jgi:hypothetical protein
MFKKALADTISKSMNLGVNIPDGKDTRQSTLNAQKLTKFCKLVDCSQFTSCGSCIAQEGCGFCGNLGQCVSGGWFGALDKSTCGLNDYYYHQCHSKVGC